MTKTLEMEVFQKYNYFTTSIEAILQKLKDFNKSSRKDTMQFILTKDLVNAWEKSYFGVIFAFAIWLEFNTFLLSLLNFTKFQLLNHRNSWNQLLRNHSVTPAKTMTTQILTGSQSDIYNKCRSSTYDNNSTLSVRLRQIRGINILIETFENLISSKEYCVETSVSADSTLQDVDYGDSTF
ncbi:13934_t:CDS:2 [Cetraspora pellucida]|uniref:13934_t:CDS:1 n=1 Tax=Cetraspora pellucida TaxID=1433469 RepID=A0A9N9AZZ4_9GLOM|nr:13934_t:CDS:2 [Cetraspora pellucida]